MQHFGHLSLKVMFQSYHIGLLLRMDDIVLGTFYRIHFEMVTFPVHSTLSNTGKDIYSKRK